MALRLTEAEYRALLLRRRDKPTGVRIKLARSGKGAEDEFAAQLDACVILHQREFKFLADRKFRFDFAMLPLVLKLAVELDGGVHRIDSRWRSDREKFNLALQNGWRVFHISRDQIRSGEAIELVRGALQAPAIRLPSQSILDAEKTAA